MSQKQPIEEDYSAGWMDRARAKKEAENRRSESKKSKSKLLIIIILIVPLIGGVFAGLNQFEKKNARLRAEADAEHDAIEKEASKMRAAADEEADRLTLQKREDDARIAESAAKAKQIEESRDATLKKEEEDRIARTPANTQTNEEKNRPATPEPARLEDGQLNPKNELTTLNPVFLMTPKGYSTQTRLRLVGWHGTNVVLADLESRRNITLDENELTPAETKLLSDSRDSLRRQINTLQSSVYVLSNGNKNSSMVFAQRGFLLSDGDTGSKEIDAYASCIRIQSPNTTYTVDFPVLIRTFWCGTQSADALISNDKGALIGCKSHMVMEDFYKTITNKPCSHFTSSVRRCDIEARCYDHGRFKGYAVVIYNLTNGKSIYQFGSSQEVLEMAGNYPVPKSSAFIEGKLAVTMPRGTQSGGTGSVRVTPVSNRQVPMPGIRIR